MRSFSDRFCFNNKSWRRWFTLSAFIFDLRSTVEVRLFLFNYSYISVHSGSWEWAFFKFGCWIGCYFCSSSSLFISSFHIFQSFRRRNILVGKEFLFLIYFFEILFCSLIKCIPLLNDFGNNLGFSEFGELGFVFVVLLPGELTIDSAKSLISTLFSHLQKRIIILTDMSFRFLLYPFILMPFPLNLLCKCNSRFIFNTIKFINYNKTISYF